MGGLYHEGGAGSSIAAGAIPLARADALPRALALAESVFETFRVIGGRVFRLEAHVARMRRGLAAFGYAPSEAALREVFDRALREAARAGGDVMARLTLGGGEAARGLGVRAPLAGWLQLGPPPDDAPARLVCWQARGRLPARKAKFACDYAAFLRDWHERGQAESPPPESLLVVTGGKRARVVSGAVANVLIFREGRWFTPRIAGGVLPGVVRGFLVGKGVVTACACPAAWLRDCEALALTNAGVFVRPVAALDGRALPSPPAALSLLRDALRGEEGAPWPA